MRYSVFEFLVLLTLASTIIAQKQFESCTDIIPPGGFTCEQQAGWGKCNKTWMTQGNYCRRTCKKCQLSQERSDEKVFTIVLQFYTGFFPLEYAYKEGILEKYAQQEGIKIKVVEDNVTQTYQQFASGEIDGYFGTVHNLVGFGGQGGALPAVVLVSSWSKGADALISKKFNQVSELKGQDINMDNNTLSTYILQRALQANNMSLEDINMVILPPDQWVDTYGSCKIDTLLGFDPDLRKAQEVGGGNVVYSTADIPQDIVDLLIVNKQVLDKNPGLGRALSGAYFEVLSLMQDQSGDSEIMKWMGQKSGSTGDQFLKDLEKVNLFYDPQDCIDFIQGDKMQSSIDNQLKFHIEQGLLGGTTDPNNIGIDVAGKTKGDEDNMRIFISDEYCASIIQNKKA